MTVPTPVGIPGAENANTYIALGNADNPADGTAEYFISSMVENEDVVAWNDDTLTSRDQKQRALFAATQRLDRECFIGIRASEDQALEWPRIGARRPRVTSSIYATGFFYYRRYAYYEENEIPDEVKWAQAHLAVYLNANRGGLDLSGLEDYRSVQIGNLAVSPYRYGAVGTDRIPPIVQRYLDGLRIGGPSNVSVRRA